MTTDEFKKFKKHLFATFPDLVEWLKQNSPDPELSVGIWERSLADCQLNECMHVLDDWITGKRPAFKAYERSQVAILIRQCVEFDRDKENRKNFELSERDRVHMAGDEFRKTRDKNYKPLALQIPELRPIYERGAKMKRDFLEGKISKEQYENMKTKLLEEVK